MILPFFQSTFTWNEIRWYLCVTSLMPFGVKSSAPIQRSRFCSLKNKGTVSEMERWFSSIPALFLTVHTGSTERRGPYCWAMWLVSKLEQNVERTWVQTMKLFTVLAAHNWTKHEAEEIWALSQPLTWRSGGNFFFFFSGSYYMASSTEMSDADYKP